MRVITGGDNRCNTYTYMVMYSHYQLLNNTMSHPNPTHDPADLDEALLAAQDEEHERARAIYDAIIILKHANDEDLKEIALGLTNGVKERLITYLQ